MSTWLMTYFLHSSVLIGSVALLRRFFEPRRLQLEQSLWRTAVFGAMLTATLQVGVGIEPLAGVWSLGTSHDSVAVESAIPFVNPASAIAYAKPSVHDTRWWSRLPIPSLETVMVTCWTLVALMLSLLLAGRYLGLEHRLAGRQRIEDGSLFALLQRLLDGMEPRPPIRLSTSSRIDIPLAKGWWRHEICLPERALTDLTVSQQEIILAHELAHLRRHDPGWLALLRLTEAIFFFQPLNRYARRRLSEIAEYRCDDWAVRRTGRPLTMARCLARVAEWNLQADHSPLPTSALTARGRGLGKRIERLLDRHDTDTSARRPRWLPAAAAGWLLVTALALPGLSVSHPGDESPSSVPAPEPGGPLPEPHEPSTPPEPATLTAPPGPAPAVPVGAPQPPSPTELPRRPRAVEGRWPTLEAQYRALLAQHKALEAQLGEVENAMRTEAAALESEARARERTLTEKMARVERVSLEGIEAQEAELRHRVELRELQRVRLEQLHGQLQETVERHRALQAAELEELREQQQRLLRELREDEAEDPGDP